MSDQEEPTTEASSEAMIEDLEASDAEDEAEVTRGGVVYDFEGVPIKRYK